MRILFLNDLHDPRIGSSVRLVYQLAERLRARGHSTLLVSTTQDPQLATPTKIEGLEVVRIWSEYPLRFRAFVGLDNKRVRAPLASVLAEWHPDVVHSHLVHTQLSYASLTQAREAGAGVVFTAHDVMTFCHQKLTCFHGGEEHGGTLHDVRAYWQKCLPCQRLRWNPWRNRAIRRVLERDVHRTSAVSQALAGILRENSIHVDRVLHNALAFRPALPDAAAVAAFRERFGLSGAQVLAIGGRLHEQKGVRQLLRMLARLAPRFPALRLLVLGKRELYEQEFAAQARELGVDERVVRAGWLEGEELQAALAATDVFVTPSICFDTFGMVNLEAMEHGKPVVATSFGGSPEVVEDGVTGFIANPFDLEAFSEHIARLLADPELARRMGAAGQVRLQAQFGIERLTDECLEEYEFARAAARGSIPRA
ncbi:MAG: glycosyltransferase family 4 protein [Planctomycetes bacterium]|nr:glycosyltransferase family 4 protein [Planctomycetota bacterium]